MSNGIDYGMGTTNIDLATGIRFGVVPMNALSPYAWDDLEADYGEPHCPKCGNDAVKGDSDIDADVVDERYPNVHTCDDDCRADGCHGPDKADVSRDDLGYETLHHACGDYACDSCGVLFDGEDAYGEEAIGHTLDDGEYKATVGQDGDLFVLSSPYYTHARFCSPCAPGACYLTNPTDKSGPRAYCLGHEWFENGKAPYPIFRIADGTLVKPTAK
jgi:hypothetical protein